MKLDVHRVLAGQGNFLDITEKREPVIVSSLDLGPCVKTWTPEYLSMHDSGLPVVAHVSRSPDLDFLSKNFTYDTMSFSEVVTQAATSTSSFYYLRSLASEEKTKSPADFFHDFPTLASDFHMPDFLPRDRIFSSVLRIASANLSLWTHYDVMDNMLIQVRGEKTVTLFPPSDALNLYLQGDKSLVPSVEEPDLGKFPAVARATRFEAVLRPGDGLFIPALWFHSVKSASFTVSINVFWRHLQESLYDKKDVYGNKDLLPAVQVDDSKLSFLVRFSSRYVFSACSSRQCMV